MRAAAALPPAGRAIAVAALLAHAVPAAATGLLEVFEVALDSDPTYLSAADLNRAAQERLPQARSALLPNVNAGLSASGVDQDIRNDLTGRQNPNFDRKEFTLTLTQPLYRQDLWIALEQAGSQVRQADVEFALARQDLMVRVAERYFAVLQAVDQLGFAQATLEAFEQQLRQAKQRFEVGLIAITDVEEAQAGYDRARADVIEAEFAVTNTGEALREVTGRYYRDLSPLGQSMPLVTPDPDDVDAWTRTALAQNLSLAATRLASQTAQAEIRRNRSLHLPVLDLFASHERTYQGSGALAGGSNVFDNSVGVQVTLPVYKGGRIMSQTRESEHLYQRSLDELELQRREAQRQTRDSYLGVKAGISRVNALSQAVRSAQSAKEAIEAGFQVGTRTSVDVLNAETDLFRARRDHSVTRYQYIVNILRLKRAAGTLSDEDIDQVDSWLD